MRALAASHAVARSVSRSVPKKLSALALLLALHAPGCLATGANVSLAQASPEQSEDYDPFAHPEAWPLEERSNARPFVVRFASETDREVAVRVRGALEDAWSAQVDRLGFFPPFPDDPSGQGLFHVFLARGLGTGVEAVNPVSRPDVNWGARESYLVIDAWGPYGGTALESTIQHEFNHALQAAYSWEEDGSWYEMSSNFIQEKTRPGLNPDFHLEQRDFQSRARFAPFRYDDYESYAMYGSSIYLHYLEQAEFGGDASFLPRIWSRLRKKPGERSPSFPEALARELPPGRTFEDTITGFAAWRYYTGVMDDGKHLDLAYEPEPQDGVPIALELGPSDSGRRKWVKGTHVYGTQYVKVRRGPRASASLRFSGDLDARWVIQAVPGLNGADREPIEPREGKIILSFGELAERTLVVTALPKKGSNRSSHEFSLRLR